MKQPYTTKHILSNDPATPYIYNTGAFFLLPLPPEDAADRKTIDTNPAKWYSIHRKLLIWLFLRDFLYYLSHFKIFMSDTLRKFLKKAVVITVLSTVYALWFWKDAGLSAGLLCANVLSVVGMVFFVYGLIGLVHNTHALGAFTYSFRYVVNMVRNARNRDDATDKEIISYPEFVASYVKWPDVHLAFIAAAILIVLSLVLWFLF